MVSEGLATSVRWTFKLCPRVNLKKKKPGQLSHPGTYYRTAFSILSEPLALRSTQIPNWHGTRPVSF
ncbi:hypothetical protein JCM31598_24760 [Desulfonatronum parangueonense]